MKKIYSIVMMLAMMVTAFSFAACSSKQKDNNNGNATEVITTSDDIDNSEQDIKFIKEWYDYVIGTKRVTDNVLNKYLSSDLKKQLWTEDYEGCYEFWQFRTTAQDSSPDGDVSKIENITNEGDGWYTVTYKDMGWSGLTKIKVKDGKIVEFVPDKTWNSVLSEQDNQEERDLSWLQGHWVYEQGNYKGHFIIQGNTITQYSSMNPEHVENTYRIEGDEIRAKVIDGMDLTAKIDFANQRIDYGNGQWMHKISSEGNSQKVASSEERLFRNEDDVYMNFVSQTFVDNSGLKIRFGGNGEMEIDGDYAGIARVKSYNSQRAILKYSGGAYGEGFIILSIEGGTAKLIDPNDPSSVWYRKRTF